MMLQQQPQNVAISITSNCEQNKKVRCCWRHAPGTFGIGSILKMAKMFLLRMIEHFERRPERAIVKFLANKGVSIHVGDVEALRFVAVNRHLEDVKFSLDKNDDVHAVDDKACRGMAENGHFGVAKLLVGVMICRECWSI
jgi:hypothetical protein